MKRKDPLLSIRGVGAVTLTKLNALGIYTLRDLLNYFPIDYKDLSNPRPLSYEAVGTFCVIYATVTSVTKPAFVRSNFNFFRAYVTDSGTRATLTWFNQPYLAQRLESGKRYVFFGKLVEKDGGLTMANPSFEAADRIVRLRGIVPIYRTKGLFAQSAMSDYVRDCIDKYDFRWGDMTEDDVVALREAYTRAHFPTRLEELNECYPKLAEEELRVLMYSYRIDRANAKTKKFIYDRDYEVMEQLIRSLPYRLTDSQRSAIDDITTDLHRPTPMNRLLSGDVGSGKTAVAVAVMAYTASCGGQCAMLAPTEILAYQHYEKIKKTLEGCGFCVACLTSSLPAAEKRRVLKGLADGSIDVVIGTSGIISEKVVYKGLALAVVDESHRFGVRTRATLIAKGENTDTLIMTATPIPRAISLMSYGELSVSGLERRRSIADSIDTLLYPDLDAAMPIIEEELKAGRQAYFVCPRVEETEEGDETASVKSAYTRIRASVPDRYGVEILHGKMKDDEKERVMASFARGDTAILVASVVIEVGIDVANASVMCIMDPSGFGMATLHQLRGRVGRGDARGKCILLYGRAPSDRIKQFAASTDGLELAELDYKRRGAGDYIGYRQSGASSDGSLQTYYSIALIEKCRRYVDALPMSSVDIEQFVESDRYVGRRTEKIAMN